MLLRVAVVAFIALLFSFTPPASAQDATKDAFTVKLEAYSAQSSTMSPEQAAEGWLALADESLERPAPTGDSDEIPVTPADQFRKALAALPPPAAWGALSTAIDARPLPQGRAGIRALGLRLIGHVLIGDEEAQQADVAALDALTKSSGTFADRAAAEYVVDLFPAGGDNVAAAVSQFERSVQRASRDDYDLYAPDLVTLVGRERAAPILRKALAAPVTVQVYVGDETQRLARELALQYVDELKVPQWHLVEFDDLALFEAMDKRFALPTTRQSGGLFAGLFGAGGDGGKPERNWQRDNAERTYLLGLLAAGRTDDAKRVITRMRERAKDEENEEGNDEVTLLPYDTIDQLTSAGDGTGAYEALHAILSESPELPLWAEYRALATRAGRTEQMIESARAALKRDALPPEQQSAIRLQLHHALLAADRVDDAVAVLRELMNTVPDAAEEESDGMPGNTRLSFATDLLELGLLLDNHAWRDEGVRIAEAEIAKGTAEAEIGIYPIRQAAAALVDAGRGAQVVALLTELMVREQTEAAESAEEYDQDYDYDYADDEDTGPPATLIDLLGVYHRAGRPDDVVALLDAAPLWGASDLSEMYTSTDIRETSVGYIAADALLAAGKRDAALEVIDALLESDGGFDGVYELRMKAGSDDEVLARFDELRRRNPFEERPLIWKAHVLHRGGKLDEAERLARQAIAMDSFDGNHTTCYATARSDDAGHRMRAHAVLADVLHARGDAKGAEAACRVVQATRTAQQADRLYDQGLLTRAHATYREALAAAPEVYTVHARLAVRLEELGRTEEAANHYRKAYELMPASFGRIESQCFDCDEMFASPRAREIADQVLTRLLDAQPKSPQVPYLLGRLREEQGRMGDALAMYRAAVALDPDHLGAWQQIEGLTWSTRMSARQSDAAILNSIRLDPLQRKTSPDFSGVRDQRALWSAIETMLEVKSAEPKSLYPLAASAAEVAKAKAADDDEAADAAEGDDAYDYYDDAYTRPTSPGQAVAQSRVITTIAELIADEE